MADGVTGQLERLQALHARGALTDAELEAARQQVVAAPAAHPVGAPPARPATSMDESRDEMRRRGEVFHHYPVWLMVVLTVLTLGIYMPFWLNHWHGLMPKRRPDDPGTGQAIGFLFIPLFAVYWYFESQLRLCTRLDEEFVAAGLPDRVLRELVRFTCIIALVPYLDVLALLVLAPVAVGMLQSQVNHLANCDQQWLARNFAGVGA